MDKETPPLRIMVVDDDALSRDVLALLLRHAGYDVETADSGDAAVNHLKTTSGPPPAVVLADIQMPGTTGSALAHALRDHCGTATRLLAMSGSPPGEEVTREFDGLLLKPFSMEELKHAIGPDSGPAALDGNSVHRDPPGLNEAIYEKLAASMRKERLQQLYALCLTDIHRRIARMRNAASYRADEAFRREAHAIRGGTGMVGAVELQKLAEALEQGGIPANHVASLDGLMFACERLRRILVARKII